VSVSALSLTPLQGIPHIRQGDDLADIILSAMETSKLQLKDGDILVIAQKIVSKAEGRMRSLSSVLPSRRARSLAGKSKKDPRLVELILQESNEILRVRAGLIIVEHRLGFICANAGIDRSNVASQESETHERVLLLPENPDRSAKQVRDEIEAKTEVHIGVVIIDSHGRAWRNGTLGTSIGLSGIPGVVDLRGQPDLFGFRLRITQVAAADELAAAASLVMGQANEGHPVIHVRGFPYPLREASMGELLRPKKGDLFR
jgi:coenzyme F420-0:L-glutamate ligase/coenzyme F420-1:gamma-L-glutamate ligase